MELQTEKRFNNLSVEQIQALDKILTEVIPIHGRGNFPTLQVRAKDIIRVVKDRLVERDIMVKDIRLNGATASHILVRDNGLGYRDLDIIFGVELPRQEDFQVIKEVVLSSLRDLLPYGVNRRKITCLTMKEAYVQKMVKVFNEHDRWSLISLSNNRAKTVELRFVSSLRRQFEFSVDSFQIILDRMLESYWVMERKQEGKLALNTAKLSKRERHEDRQKEQLNNPQNTKEDVEKGSSGSGEAPCQEEEVSVVEKEHHDEIEPMNGELEVEQVLEPKKNAMDQTEEKVNGIEDVRFEENIAVGFKMCEKLGEGKEYLNCDHPLVSSPKFTELNDTRDALTSHACLKPHCNEEGGKPQLPQLEKSPPQGAVSCQEKIEVDSVICRTENAQSLTDPHLEFSFPPPAKKTCSTTQDVKPDYCPSPKLQRKMSRKMISKPDKWFLLNDLSDLTTQLFPPIEIPKTLQSKPPSPNETQVSDSIKPNSKSENFEGADLPTDPCSSQDGSGSCEAVELNLEPAHSTRPPEVTADAPCQPKADVSRLELADAGPNSCESNSWFGASGEPIVTVEAECMYGDFEQALHHLRHRLIATHNPEEIRGGGLLKYSDLLVRNFRPASETEIKSLERYMCSRFFIDFPDVGEQQRKIEAYLQCHFIGSEETSKYDYLMTLRRVIDESTVCLMGHERRQTLNMITVLALRVLGEQNAIPNTANVTCFYQPAPYMTEPIYNSYYITQAQPPLVYHPYPLHVHMQTGLV
ncbi:Protein FAM46C [Oryzias melastigma]|uniref:polynucleotide adenylyltransferase n=1 Tax=Oryzias melastigma TaxID=30732 RepID=A0A834FC94_ORYME|nr:Protein FAM46C [Oryzias melastigma]